MKQSKQKHVRGGFWQGRGFYVILAACLIAVGGFGVVTLVETLSSGETTEPPTASTTTAAPVGQTVPSVRDTRTTAPATTTTAVPTAAPTEDVAVVADLFILPLTNEVLAAYSAVPVYSATLESWQVHSGTDFCGTRGQDVKALADGVIEDIYYDAMWGDCVVLDHGGGVQSVYCGVQTKRQVGETVEVGEVIGLLADIPCECRMEPHLHLEIRESGKPLDPVAAIGRDVRYSDSAS